jgi:hypothetical protein
VTLTTAADPKVAGAVAPADRMQFTVTALGETTSGVPVAPVMVTVAVTTTDV